MNTNDAIKQVHAALVAKAKAKCAVDGSNRLAVDIGAKLADYGKEWAEAFGNDGVLDDSEEAVINRKFAVIVDNYIPKKDGILVDKAWNGFSFCLIKVFKGVKNYLNEWFGLELK